jgi:hypothetical protein
MSNNMAKIPVPSQLASVEQHHSKKLDMIFKEMKEIRRAAAESNQGQSGTIALPY